MPFSDTHGGPYLDGLVLTKMAQALMKRPSQFICPMASLYPPLQPIEWLEQWPEKNTLNSEGQNPEPQAGEGAIMVHPSASSLNNTPISLSLFGAKRITSKFQLQAHTQKKSALINLRKFYRHLAQDKSNIVKDSLSSDPSITIRPIVLKRRRSEGEIDSEDENEAALKKIK